MVPMYGQHAAEDNEELVCASKKTSNSAWDILRGIEGSDDGTDTDTQAGNEAADV